MPLVSVQTDMGLCAVRGATCWSDSYMLWYTFSFNSAMKRRALHHYASPLAEDRFSLAHAAIL